MANETAQTRSDISDTGYVEPVAELRDIGEDAIGDGTPDLAIQSEAPANYREDVTPQTAAVPPAPSISSRLHDARYTLAAVAIGLLCLVLLGEVRFDLALGLLVAVFAAAALSPRRSRVERRARVAAAKMGTANPQRSARTLCDAFANPIFLISAQGILLHANPGAQRVFGTARSGVPFLFKFRNPEISAMIVAALEEQRPATATYVERQPTERIFSVSINPVGRSGETGPVRLEYFVVSFEDRTEARRSDTMRTDFIANASHELRTPLASLSGFIETLRGPARNDVAARDRFLDVMQEQSERMSRLVDDLLSLSRIEMRVHRQPSEIVDINDVVGHVLDALQPLASEADVQLKANLPPNPVLIYGERDELVQVYDNLVDNAIKYGRDGKAVSVTVKAQNDDPLHPVTVSVRDYGAGIAAEHLPRLTERFYRVDADASRSKKGTGLGLAIVKHILTRHKGRLEITSEQGEGATFTTRYAKVSVVKSDK
ncbi:MAG: ATP-binding protein [Pseudomonadota bacterium]